MSLPNINLKLFFLILYFITIYCGGRQQFPCAFSVDSTVKTRDNYFCYNINSIYISFEINVFSEYRGDWNFTLTGCSAAGTADLVCRNPSLCLPFSMICKNPDTLSVEFYNNDDTAVNLYGNIKIKQGTKSCKYVPSCAICRAQPECKWCPPYFFLDGSCENKTYEYCKSYTCDGKNEDNNDIPNLNSNLLTFFILLAFILLIFLCVCLCCCGLLFWL